MARSAFLCVNCVSRSILQGRRDRVIASTKEMGTRGPVCQNGAWTWQLPVALYGPAPITGPFLVSTHASGKEVVLAA